MAEPAADLIAEADELHAFLGTLDPAAWERPTRFKDWTPWDVVAHLHFFDAVSLLAVDEPEAFAQRRRDLLRRVAEGIPYREIARSELADLVPTNLVEAWIEGCHGLADRLCALDPAARLPWFGPDMGGRMFATARLMETWAHGQAIYDLVGATREPTRRLEHIAVLGVKTYGWSFAVRKLEPPGPPPHVRLTAPAGECWEWNEPNEAECIAGPALDFCQVVTQVRNVADTRLEVTGPVARRWMSIAQCFAGGAETPPAPGDRTADR